MLDNEFVEMLACPKCKGELKYDAEASTLTCEGCRLEYRVEDDVPVLLIEEAKEI